MKWTEKNVSIVGWFCEVHCMIWPVQLTKVTFLRKLALAEPWGLCPPKHLTLWVDELQKKKKAPFSELGTHRPGPGVGGYTLAGFQPHLARGPGLWYRTHHSQLPRQQLCWNNIFVMRILLGFYLLHEYLLSAYLVSTIGNWVCQWIKQVKMPTLKEFTIWWDLQSGGSCVLSVCDVKFIITVFSRWEIINCWWFISLGYRQ